MTKAVVIYHANCTDGFTAAYVFSVSQRAESYTDVDYIPMSYGQAIDWNKLEKADHCYILDFSFPRELLKQISYLFEKVVLIDHHKTAQEDLTNWPECPKNIEIIFDMNKSGAGLTWEYLNPGVTPPSLVSYVEDRDLWKFALSYSKPVNAYISFCRKEFSSYRYLEESLEDDLASAVDKGRLLERQHQEFCEDMATNLAREVTIHGADGTKYRGLACNCTGHFASEVGNLLQAQSKTFGATYYSDKTGAVKWSLRSSGTYDVSAIAKRFGGGGHRTAAGFTVFLSEPLAASEINLFEIPPTNKENKDA